MSSTVNNSFPTSKPAKFPPVYIVNRQPPTINEWYTVCDLKGNLAVGNIMYAQSNGEAANKNIEVEITIDGNVFDATFDSQNYASDNSTSRVVIFAYVNFNDGNGANASDPVRGIATCTANPISTQIAVPLTFMMNAAFVRCSSFKYRLRLTSNPGSNQVLKAIADVLETT